MTVEDTHHILLNLTVSEAKTVRTEMENLVESDFDGLAPTESKQEVMDDARSVIEKIEGQL